ncbi:MAG: cytidine(C)-cytidine(C)-adenosine (A)]-adding enzyme [Nitrospinaceae bacterium]|nr:MAG: cytidine(C)-cytidine(C)-adenosine (A)]-adding enzyme [Nitrospinaceae bacterium]
MGGSSKKYLQTLLEITSKNDEGFYLVGGSVRDHLLGKDGSDFDFTGQNVAKIARRFASENKSPCVPLDDTPGRETFRVIIEKRFNFDFTDMQGNSIEEDLAQRDFTINAMAIRLDDFLEDKKTFIDLKQGQSDLKNGIVRVMPGNIFSADPCRMLRAFRFAGTLNFEIEAETLHKIESQKSSLEKTAPERIYNEWLLFLGSQPVYSLLRLMDQTGLLECVLPETKELQETALDTVKHLEGLIPNPETILAHNSPLKIFTGKKTALLKFAGLLYQLMPSPSGDFSIAGGKLDEPSKIVQLLKKLRASNADIQFIYRTILCRVMAADSNLSFAGEKIDESKMYQFVKNNESELIPGIFLACAVESALAKERGTTTDEFFQAAYRVSEFYFQRYLPAMDENTLLNGDDLIRHFKLSPSPLFQVILEQIEEARVLGTIKSKNEAEAVAKKIIQTQQVQ